MAHTTPPTVGYRYLRESPFSPKEGMGGTRHTAHGTHSCSSQDGGFELAYTTLHYTTLQHHPSPLSIKQLLIPILILLVLLRSIKRIFCPRGCGVVRCGVVWAVFRVIRLTSRREGHSRFNRHSSVDLTPNIRDYFRQGRLSSSDHPT